MKQSMHCPATVSPDLLGIKRKKTYETRKAAQAADKLARPYLCHHCKKWHLTTRKK